MVGRSVFPSHIQYLLASLLSTRKVLLPHKIPASLAISFRQSFTWRANPKEFSYGAMANMRMFCRFAPSIPFIQCSFLRIIPRVRFGALTSYPFDPWIPNLKRSRHICFTYCWTLTSRTGVDENGKKGIFPSNYVRLKIPDGTRPGHQNGLTCSIHLAFRSCWLDGWKPSTPVPYYLTWRMINCDILAPETAFPETHV